MQFVWEESRIVPNPENPRKPRTLNSYGIRWNATVQTDKGSEVWRYFERETIVDGAKFYTPTRETFDGSLSLGINDIDKILFLMYFCPAVKQSRNVSKVFKNIYIELKDTAKRASNEVKKDIQITYIKSKIYEIDQNSLTEVHIRRIARALFIVNAETDSIDEVRRAIVGVAERDNEGLVKVEEILKPTAEKYVEIRSIIQEAEEMGYIGVMAKPDKRSWYYKSEDGVFTDFICAVDSRIEDPKEALAIYYETIKPEGFEDLKEMMKDNKVTS